VSLLMNSLVKVPSGEYELSFVAFKPKNSIKLSEKLRMSKINLFFDTIVYLYRCITKIFLCNSHELSFKDLSS